MTRAERTATARGGAPGATTGRRQSVATAVATGALALGAALLGNLAALGVGRLAGADMLVQPPTAPQGVPIGALMVIGTTLVPLALGVGALVAAARWWAPGWRVLAWAGLAVALLTIALPFTAGATTSTALTLASMHVITGVLWFQALRHGAARARLGR